VEQDYRLAAETLRTNAQASVRSTRACLKRFFPKHQYGLDEQALADFLQYPSGQPKIAIKGTPRDQLTAALSGVRFKRGAFEQPAAQNDVALLNTLIAQSDQQNQITSRFLQFLG
jgi:hypothetical protein